MDHPASWEDLPIIFRIGVAKRLDETSRVRLRRCSKLDKFAVDCLPIHIRYLKFYELPGRFMRSPKFLFSKHQWTNVSGMVLDTWTMRFNETVSHVLTTFKCVDSTVDELVIGDNSDDGDQENEERVTRKVIMYMRKRTESGRKPKLNVKRLVVNVVVENVIEFIGFFNPETLTSLNISTGNIHFSKKATSELLQMEQWRNLKVIRFAPRINCDLSSFHDIDRLELHLEELNIEDLSAFIKNTQFKKPPFDVFFFLFTRVKMQESFKYQVLENFNSKIENENYQTITSIDDDFICKFKAVHDEMQTLAVVFEENKVFGMICENEPMEDLIATVMLAASRQYEPFQ